MSASPPVLALLLRAAWRFHLTRPLELALCILGLSLGVSLVVAMDLSIDSARRGFDASTTAVFGTTTQTVEGRADALDESFYPWLRRTYPELPAAPVVQGRVRLSAVPGEDRGRALTLLGVAPLAESGFRDYVPAPGTGGALTPLLLRPGAVLATPGTADRLAADGEGRFSVIGPGGDASLVLLAALTPGDPLAEIGLRDVLVADIATAQEVLRRHGRLSRIDLRVETESQRAMLASLRAALPAEVVIRDAAARSRAATQMTASFYLSLRMLSLLALVVGVFIVYNTMAFAVVRRRRDIGTLRAVGVSAREVLAAVILEGVCLSAIGAVLGVMLGLWLGDALLGLVIRTIDDLYFRTSVAGVIPGVDVLLRGVLCGVGGGVIAALIPALEATRVAPRSALLAGALERRLLRAVPWLPALALVLGLLAAGLIQFAGTSLLAAYAALFALVMAGAVLAPWLTVALGRGLAGLMQRRMPVLLVMGVRGAARGISRTGVAVGALAVALATAAGMALMVDSFRGSLQAWLGTTLEADLYVGLDGGEEQRRLPDGLASGLSALEGIEGLSRSTDRSLAREDGPLWLKAVNTDGPRYRELAMRAGTGDPWEALRAGKVLVSEPLVRRLGLEVADLLSLPTPSGEAAFEIAGVFRDYGSDRGMALIGRETYRRHYADDAVTGIGIHVTDPAALAQLQESVVDAVQIHPDVRVRSTRWIREASMSVFDRTFAITRVMQILATLVACVGMISALTALALERRHEHAVLRAQGATGGELFLSLQLHNATLGLAAGALAVPLGIVMARVLVDVVNRRAFGWSMDFSLSVEVLALTAILALAAALLAGLYPGWSAARRPPAATLGRP